LVREYELDECADPLLDPLRPDTTYARVDMTRRRRAARSPREGFGAPRASLPGARSGSSWQPWPSGRPTHLCHAGPSCRLRVGEWFETASSVSAGGRLAGDPRQEQLRSPSPVAKSYPQPGHFRNPSHRAIALPPSLGHGTPPGGARARPNGPDGGSLRLGVRSQRVNNGEVAQRDGHGTHAPGIALVPDVKRGPLGSRGSASAAYANPSWWTLQPYRRPTGRLGDGEVRVHPLAVVPGQVAHECVMAWREVDRQGLGRTGIHVSGLSDVRSGGVLVDPV
jgi:hypothetical protein